MEGKNPRQVILGFDGGTWSIINSMLAEGLLPNIRKIMENGVYAKLRSPLPLSTPIIWTTIYTGASKETHGIRNFFNTAHDIAVPRIWDVLMHEGRTAGVAGNYFTYPINEKLSFCIPSHFDPDVTTTPKRYEFIRRITKAIESKNAGPGTLVRNCLSAIRNGLRFTSLTFAARSVLGTVFNRTYFNTYHRFQRVFMDMSMDTFLHAYKSMRPDFAAFYTPLPDTVSHKYWSFHEPEKFGGVDPELVKKYGNIIRKTYRHCDRRIGSVLRAISDDTQICVLSDHGFKAMENPCDRIVVVPQKLIDLLGLKGRTVITTLGHQAIVQPKTSELTRELLKVFQEAYITRTEKPVFRDFVVDEETNTFRFHVNWKKLSRIDTPIALDGKEISMEDIAKVGSTWTGDHHAEDGLFMMAGPGIPKGGEKETIDAYDITPTLLRLQRIDISSCTDGNIREDMIDDQWTGANPASVIESYSGIVFKPGGESEAPEEAIAEKLKSLGYM